MPLLGIAPTGQFVYNPFSHCNTKGLIAKLPPLTGGASAWISALKDNTAGEIHALGDICAMFSCIEGVDVTMRLMLDEGISLRVRRQLQSI